jgi:hypothetical protein
MDVKYKSSTHLDGLRRFYRWVFRASVVWLIFLLMIISLLWKRGYYCRDVFTWYLGKTSANWIESVKGCIQIARESNTSVNGYEIGWKVMDAADPIISRRVLGFGVLRSDVPIWNGTQASVVHLLAIDIPNWSLFTLFGVLIASP